MKTHFYLRASVQNTISHLISVWIIAVLLAGAAFSAQPVGKVLAASCTSTIDGDWSNPSIWSCGHVPTSADDVIIDNTLTTGVTINADQSVQNLTINPFGILVFGSAVTFTITGNFYVDATGLFDPGSGTVVFSTGSQTITTNGVWVDFWNLSKIASGSGETLSVDPPIATVGGIHVLNNLTLKGTAAPIYLLLRSTIDGTQWQIDPAGSRDIDYVDVKDSNNVNAMIISVLHGIDSGNNSGWALTGSSVALTSSANPSIFGQPVTFIATITPNTATGTVAFMDGSTTISGCDTQPVTVTVGVASSSCTTSTLALGNHSITAVYSGDATYGGSTSSPLTQVVNQFSSVSLTSSVNPSIFGTPVTFTAMVMPMAATGTVAFQDGGVNITGCDSQPVTGGVASCTTSALALGSHSITAVYSGNATYAGSISTPLTQDVKNTSSVVVVSSKNPSVIGAQVVFTATVSPADATGTVTFLDGGANITGCVYMTLTTGQATCTVSNLIVGSHSITAVYSGDTVYQGSTSPVLTQVVIYKMIFMPIIIK